MLEVTAPHFSDSSHCEVSKHQVWPMQHERIPLIIKYFYTELKGACEVHQATNNFFYLDGGT
jgi:hypothetical protein